MLENENKSAQTTDEVISDTVENADNGTAEAEADNDLAFGDGTSGDENVAGAQKAEEKQKHTKEENAENARRRREEERSRELEAMRHKTILEVLGGVNPYTKEPMKDSEDVKEYLEMKEIAASGKDPVADYARWKKQKEKERAAEEKKAADEREWRQKDSIAFAEAYPDVKIEDLAKNPNFLAFAAGKVGTVPLADIYRDYTETGNAFVKEYQEKVAKERANKNASPGSLGSGGSPGEYFTPEQVRDMSRTEIRKNMKAIEASMKKW